MLLDNRIWVGSSPEGAVNLLPELANRHGLISGATGTGKTVTLQVLAEGFSQLGVPVFMADVKGDLAGLARPGERNEKIESRLQQAGVSHFTNRACPVTFWDVFCEKGHPVRATVSEMGPLLLSRMLQLNDTQAGVLHLVFRIADEQGMLLIDLKDLRAMLAYVGENAQDYTIRYGNISKPSIGAIQRAIAVLEDQGGTQFFGEPALQINDWFVRDDAGHGMINILAADKLFQRPALYSVFLLWMLGELYELLPETGDKELPRMVFFFDEAHLLFEDCPRELLDRIQLTIRLIRSKGVGVFFITQNPTDIPPTVLGQLAARVQHALRAFTPQEQKVISAVAQTFRPNPAFDTQEAITQLGTGEALLSFLQEDGSPAITQKAIILPPQSGIGAISDSLRESLVDSSDLKGKYDDMFDTESAYEMLSAKFFSQGVSQTSVVHSIPMQSAQEGQEGPVPHSVQPMTFKVFDPATGQYVEREIAMPQAPAPVPSAPVPSAPVPVPAVPAQPAPVPAAPEMPPVLVFNPRTGQYEPQMLSKKEQQAIAKAEKAAEKAASKPAKTEQSALEKMLQNFTRSASSGAGYAVGRSITRNILGVFGVK